MGANSYHFAAGQGKELGNLENNIVQQKCSEAASVEGRPIAMMAARCLDVLWIRSSFSLIFFAIAASGTRNGTFFLLLCINRLSVWYISYAMAVLVAKWGTFFRLAAIQRFCQWKEY